MQKRFIFLLVGLATVLTLGLYLYNKWTEARERIDLWTLVPEDAVFVVETRDHQALVEHLKETELWDQLINLTYIQKFQESFQLIDSLAPGQDRLGRFLDTKTVLTSVHVIGKTDFDFVYYVPVSTVGEHRFVRTFIERLTKNPLFRQELREYQDFQITDLKHVQSGGQLSFFSFHNNLILSATPFLLEEVIRRINRNALESPARDHKHINYLVEDDVYAQVFINYQNLPPFLGLLFQDQLQRDFTWFSSLCRSSMLEFKLETEKVFFNGFSNPETVPGAFHARLDGQSPQPLTLRDVVPGRTALLLHFGLDHPVTLRSPIRLVGGQSPGSLAPTTVDSLARTFRKEIAICYLESYSTNVAPEKVVFAYTDTPDLTASLLERLIQQASAVPEHPVHHERQGNYSIHLISAPELPAALFGEPFSGFEHSYFSLVGKYVLFSEDLGTLRSVLADIEADEVWGKSLGQKGFLEETQHEANFSVFINTLNAWNILTRYVNDDRKAALLRHASLIRKFNQISLQFSRVEDQYYTSLLLRHQDRETVSGTAQELFQVESTVSFPQRLISPPHYLRYPGERTAEVLVQDSVYQLHAVTATGKPAWTDSVGAPLAGMIHQADLTGDGRLDYVFASNNRIHCLDRNGRPVENFPFNLHDTLRVQRLAVFDYDQNRNYRLLVDDNLGNLYMFDARGNLINGWQPRRMEYRLAATPQHFKINGRDVILVLLENGFVYALNRQGDAYPGFPFNLRSTLHSGAFARPGATFRKSQFTVVTELGEVVVFNLEGEVQKRDQLLRPNRNTFFELVPEAGGKSFVIARQDQGRVTLFDQDRSQVLEYRFVTSAPKLVQYHHFGGDRKLYTLTERGPQKTYIFNSKGQLVGNLAIDNFLPVTILYNDTNNRYSLFKAHKNELKTVVFKP
jgi:hypothetical protein